MSIQIVKVSDNKKYWDDILTIRNNNSYGFGDTKKINKTIHYEFMEKFSDHYYVLIFSDTDKVVGFVGCVDNDIRVSVDDDYKQKGFGKKLVDFIKNKYPQSFAKIKIDNEASLKLFESCGFEKTWYILEKIRVGL